MGMNPETIISWLVYQSAWNVSLLFSESGYISLYSWSYNNYIGEKINLNLHKHVQSKLSNDVQGVKLSGNRYQNTTWCGVNRPTGSYQGAGGTVNNRKPVPMRARAILNQTCLSRYDPKPSITTLTSVGSARNNPGKSSADYRPKQRHNDQRNRDRVHGWPWKEPICR